MKQFKKMFALILIACMVFSLAACAGTGDGAGETAGPADTAGGASAAEPEAPAGDNPPAAVQEAPAGDDAPPAGGTQERDLTLTIGVAISNSTHKASSSTTAMYQIATVFEYLFRMDPDTQDILPMLAEGAEWLDDTTLQVKLRQDIYFMDGQQMTAKDVLCSYRDVAAVKLPSYYANYDFDNTEIVDDFTIDFRFFEHYGSTLAWMANTPIYCEEDVLADDADKWMYEPNGTGAYYCVENVEGAYVTYARKAPEQYWGDLPACTQVTFKYYSEPTAMYIDFENGTLDVANTIGTADAERVLAGDCPAFTGYNLKAYNDVLCVVLPEENELFDDIRVREAFFKAIDAESVAIAGFGSLYMPATSILPSTLTKYYAEQEVVAYDPEGAKALLAEAGYPDGLDLRVVITLDNQTVAEALQASLATAGIRISVESYDFGTAIPMISSGDTDFVLNQSVDGAYAYEPSQSIPVSWAPGASFKPVQMDAEEWAHYFELALTTEGEERAAAYAGLQHWAAAEYRFKPICERASLTVFNTEKLEAFDLVVANRPLATCAVFR